MKLDKYIMKYGNVDVDEMELNKFLGRPEEKNWKPKPNEEYWYIMSQGCININNWLDTLENKDHLAFGNVYSSYERAEFALEKRKVEVELQRFANEHNVEIDWHNPDQTKWCLMYDYSGKVIHISGFTVIHYNTVHFTSEEIAKEAIKTIGEDRIKKYYFGVEE